MCSVSCNFCPVGKHVSGSSCASCAKRKYQPSAGQTACLQCPAVMYQGRTCQASSKTCSFGYIPDKYGNGCREAKCPAGKCAAVYVKRYERELHCGECSAGTFSHVGWTACAPCVWGKYQPEWESEKCTSCPSAKTTRKIGSTHANNCIQVTCCAGSELRRGSCSTCSSGKFNPKANGTYKACPAGTFAPRGAKTCTKCPKDTYAPHKGQSGCLSCPDGKVSEIGSTSVKACKDSWCKAGERRVSGRCEPCPWGTHQPKPHQTQCLSCPDGSHQRYNGQKWCVPCPAGKYSRGMGAIKVYCHSCPIGTYAKRSGTTRCIPCSRGTVMGLYGSSSPCEKCPAGKYQKDDNFRSCVACSNGKYQPHEGRTQCKMCRRGYIVASKTAARCSECPPGKFQQGDNYVKCFTCPFGKYQQSYGRTSCVSCPSGHIAKHDRRSCIECSPGKYISSNLSMCKLCPTGKYQRYSRAKSCTLCPKGAWSKAGSTKVSDCKVPCPRGMGYTSGACRKCPTGSYSVPKEGCAACPAGKYQPHKGQDACIPCEAGKYRKHTRGTFCDGCRPGYYAAVVGSTACTQCPKDSYLPKGPTGLPAKCQAGWITNYNKSTCTKCPKGSYSAKPGETKCMRCPVGKYCASPGQALCTSCAKGMYQNQEGRTSCKRCPAGKYNAKTGNNKCAACSKGMFGLTQSSTVKSNKDLTFATYCSSGYILVYENGVSRGYYDTFTDGVLTIGVNNDGQAVMLFDGKPFYTSPRTPSFPLCEGMSLYTAGQTVKDVGMVRIGDVSGIASVGNAVQFRHLLGAKASAGVFEQASSSKARGGSAMSFLASSKAKGVSFRVRYGTYGYVGLSRGFNDYAYYKIHFALYFHHNMVHVHEKGHRRYTKGVYQSSSRFTIVVGSDGKVYYKMNGSTFFKSSLPVEYPVSMQVVTIYRGRVPNAKWV